MLTGNRDAYPAVGQFSLRILTHPMGGLLEPVQARASERHVQARDVIDAFNDAWRAGIGVLEVPCLPTPHGTFRQVPAAARISSRNRSP